MSTRNADEDFAMLFSSVFAFSKHLVKWEDNRMRDKYDRNCFRFPGSLHRLGSGRRRPISKHEATCSSRWWDTSRWIMRLEWRKRRR